jgi:hypothetical protein
MWSDVDADPPTCPASGTEAISAPRLADDSPPPVFPMGGRGASGAMPSCRWSTAAWAPACRFRGTEDVAESAARAEWFNTFGWE